MFTIYQCNGIKPDGRIVGSASTFNGEFAMGNDRDKPYFREENPCSDCIYLNASYQKHSCTKHGFLFVRDEDAYGFSCASFYKQHSCTEWDERALLAISRLQRRWGAKYSKLIISILDRLNRNVRTEDFWIELGGHIDEN